MTEAAWVLAAFLGGWWIGHRRGQRAARAMLIGVGLALLRKD